jgi:hypothetical protein
LAISIAGEKERGYGEAIWRKRYERTALGGLNQGYARYQVRVEQALLTRPFSDRGKSPKLVYISRLKEGSLREQTAPHLEKYDCDHCIIAHKTKQFKPKCLKLCNKLSCSSTTYAMTLSLASTTYFEFT